MMERIREKVDADLLKLIAIITMTIDHLASGILVHYLSEAEINILHIIGRMAFPLYIFLLIEGYQHTRDKLKYFSRLVLLAAVSEIPYRMALFDELHPIHSSVLVTLCFGFLGLLFIDRIDCKFFSAGTLSILTGIPIIGMFLTLLAGACFVISNDYGIIGVIAIMVAYSWQKFMPISNLKTAYIQSFAFTVIVLSVLDRRELFALIDLVFIYFYNGTKKKNKAKDLLMNTYYPVHLTVIALIKKLILNIA